MTSAASTKGSSGRCEQSACEVMSCSELYECITGLVFERTDTTGIEDRIERNVLAYLKKA